MKITVSVIIPNFSGFELLKKSLPSLFKQTYKNIEVIVVDNGSTDDSVESIRRSFPGVRLIANSRNLGFATAVNKGIKNSRGKYIVLLNNDTEVDSNCVKFLVEAAEKHPEAGLISAKILNFYKRDIIDNAGDYLDVSGHLYQRGSGKKSSDYLKGEYIFLATGSGSLIKRKVFEKIGMFDEDFFFYMEDADFSLRAQLAGFKVWFEPRARIFHIRNATSFKYMNYLEHLIFQNMTCLIIKNYPKKLFLKNFNWLKIFLVHIHTLFYLISKGYILNALKVELYLIFNLKEIIKKRKKVQELKKVSDGYIIANFVDKKIKLI